MLNGYKKKKIQIFSNGSLNFIYSSFTNFKQLEFSNKDNSNFYLNSKKRLHAKLNLIDKNKMTYRKKFL